MEYVLKNRIDLNEYDDFASLTAELSEKVGEKLAYMMKLACDFNNLVYMARVRYNVMLVVKNGFKSFFTGRLCKELSVSYVLYEEI